MTKLCINNLQVSLLFCAVFGGSVAAAQNPLCKQFYTATLVKGSAVGKDPFASVSYKVVRTDKPTVPGKRLLAPNGLFGVELKSVVPEDNRTPEALARELWELLVAREDALIEFNERGRYQNRPPVDPPKFVSQAEPHEPSKLVFTDHSGNVTLTIDAINSIENRLNGGMDRKFKVKGMIPVKFSADGRLLMVSLSGSIEKLPYETETGMQAPGDFYGDVSEKRLGLAIIDLQSETVKSAFALPHQLDSIIASQDLTTITGEINFRIGSIDLRELSKAVYDLQFKQPRTDSNNSRYNQFIQYKTRRDPLRVVQSVFVRGSVSDPRHPLAFKNSYAAMGKSRFGLLYSEYYGDYKKQVFQPVVHHLRTSEIDGKIISAHRIDLRSIHPSLSNIKAYKSIRVVLESDSFVLVALKPYHGTKEIFVRMELSHAADDGALQVKSVKVFDGMRDGEEPLMTSHGDVLFLSRVFEDREEKFSLRAGDHPTVLPLANVTEVHGVERTKDGGLSIHVTFDNETHGDWIVSPREQAVIQATTPVAPKKKVRSPRPHKDGMNNPMLDLDLSHLEVGQRAFVITSLGAVGHGGRDVEIAYGEIKSLDSSRREVQMNIPNGVETFSGAMILQQPAYLTLQTLEFNRTNDLIVQAGQSYKVIGAVPSQRYPGELALVLMANRESLRFLQLTEVAEINDRSKGYTISRANR